jgi:hypothetical protein
MRHHSDKVKEGNFGGVECCAIVSVNNALSRAPDLFRVQLGVPAKRARAGIVFVEINVEVIGFKPLRQFDVDPALVLGHEFRPRLRPGA